MNKQSEHPTLSYSEAESRRFGLSIYRAVLTGIDERWLQGELKRLNADIAFIRVPSERQHELAKLQRVCVPHLVADTLVYYFVDLDKWEPRELRNADLDFVELDSETVEALDDLVEEIFAGYTNHYSANPYLSRPDFIEGYKEWARSFSHGGNPGNTGWLVRRRGEWLGFCTCSRQGAQGTGVLYGIRPSASGGGLYGDLIRFTQRYFRDLGLPSMEVSTQVHNFAVQKVWSREGFVMKESLVTAHVMPLYGKSVVPEHVERFSVEAEEIEAWGALSGDRNPLHFSDEFARSRGLDGRIAHGLVTSGKISTHYGTVFPGPGTFFQSYEFGFFRPVYPGREYKLTVRFPIAREEKGFFRSLARIEDDEGRTCLVAYSNLVRR